jgi:Trypsin-co-occurring domain 1
MADIQEIQLIDEDGTPYTLYVETKIQSPTSSTPRSLRDGDTTRETYDVLTPTAAKLSDIHRAIRLYAQYAIGAFKNLGGAEVEEIKLKFGLKIGGKGGIPILAEASSEGNFEIEVKCKFPKD